MTFRLLLVDDHQMFREALHLLLERNPRLEIVGESGDGNEALALARTKAWYGCSGWPQAASKRSS